MFKVLLLGVVTCLMSCVSDAYVLHVTTPAPLEFIENHPSYITVNQALKNLDVEVQYHYRPRIRSLAELERGEHDADLARTVLGIGSYRNIIRVREPIATSQIVAFYNKEKTPVITSLSDLSTYHIGYIKGWADFKKAASSGNTSEPVADLKSLFRMLVAGRFDAIMVEQGLGEFLRNDASVKGGNFVSSSVLSTHHVYFLLHKRHQALSEPLAKEIAKVKLNQR